ncbi:MAG: hypothetical protein HY652_08095 [Acidobacteria bacterium]|nr:hypothetical protein [Acidobacteriota bacterium]
MKIIAWSLRGAIPIVILALSAGLLYYDLLARRMEAVVQAYQANDPEQALARLDETESDFFRYGWLKRAFSDRYGQIVLDKIQLRYTRGEFDAVMDLAESSKEKISARDAVRARFWLGNSYFRKALGEKEPQAALAWLHRAEKEYREALAAEPDDWDIKYNYELVKTILMATEEKKEKLQKEVFDLLREADVQQKEVKITG